MPYRLKGFVQLSTSIESTPSTIATFGEISTQCLTYARNKRVYVNATPVNSSLIAFLSQDSTGSVEVPSSIKDKVFEISNWILVNQESINAFTTRDSFLSGLTEHFSSSIVGVNCGELLSDSTGTYFPEWIGFTQLISNTSSSFHENEIKLWYANDSFKDQYDESEIVIVPPLANIDGLFSTKANVEASLDLFRRTELLPAIQAAKGNMPESSILSESYTWIDPVNTNNRTSTDWTVLLYGRIANNLDNIKLAIREYITAHSARSESEWKKILPDVYKNTEFFVFPRWKNYAIQERQLQVGQHSSIVNLKRELDYVKTNLPLLAAAHIENNTCVVPLQYKSLCAVIVGNSENRDDIFSINQLFPDLLNVPTTDPLFELQNSNTKNWILQFINALVIAEKIGTYDSVPNGMRKQVRNNVLYVSFKHNNVEYLISTKASTPAY